MRFRTGNPASSPSGACQPGPVASFSASPVLFTGAAGRARKLGGHAGPAPFPPRGGDRWRGGGRVPGFAVPLLGHAEASSGPGAGRGPAWCVAGVRAVWIGMQGRGISPGQDGRVKGAAARMGPDGGDFYDGFPLRGVCGGRTPGSVSSPPRTTPGCGWNLGTHGNLHGLARTRGGRWLCHSCFLGPQPLLGDGGGWNRAQRPPRPRCTWRCSIWALFCTLS